MIVQDKAISDIKPYQKNPRHKYDINKVAQSIKEFGFQQPIVVDRAGVIIVGHGRYEAAKSLNLKTIPVTIADLPPEKAKAYRIADNKTNEYSDWDMGLLIQEFTDLLDINYDLELTGFDADELEKLIVGEKEGLTDEDAVPETPEEPKAQLGDIYKLGEHRLMCGDSTSATDTEKLFNNCKIDLLLTDPPYGIDYSKKNEFLNKMDKGNRVQKDIANDDITDIKQFCSDFLNIIPFNDYNIFYIFITSQQLHNVRLALNESNYHTSTYLVWNKNNHVLGRMDYLMKHELIIYGWKGRHKFYGNNPKSVINFDKPVKNDLHPTMKPVGLLEILLKDSTMSNHNVYDPFTGSGSTLLACEKNNRKFYGMELDPHYIDVIIKRWEQYTGQKAEKIN